MADAKDGDGRPGAGQDLRGVRICGLSPGAAALVLLPAVLAAIGWSNTLHEPRLMGWQKGMIMGTAPAPDQYRVLTPLLTNSIFRCTASQTVEEALRTLRHVYLAVHALAFAITGFCFVAFCRRWLTLPEALLGFALLMAICAVANLRGQIQVTDPLNLMFVTVGLWAIQQERIGLLFVAMVLGALNRESVLVLAGYYLLMEWPGPRRRVLTTTGPAGGRVGCHLRGTARRLRPPRVLGGHGHAMVQPLGLLALGAPAAAARPAGAGGVPASARPVARTVAPGKPAHPTLPAAALGGGAPGGSAALRAAAACPDSPGGYWASCPPTKPASDLWPAPLAHAELLRAGIVKRHDRVGGLAELHRTVWRYRSSFARRRWT